MVLNIHLELVRVVLASLPSPACPQCVVLASLSSLARPQCCHDATTLGLAHGLILCLKSETKCKGEYSLLWGGERRR